MILNPLSQIICALQVHLQKQFSFNDNISCYAVMLKLNVNCSKKNADFISNTLMHVF